jgi:signal transduction histidine kinase
MKGILRSIFICLLVNIPGFGFQIDSTGYFMQQFTDESGLPQNSVTGMAFDNIGFIWITTQGGLARFDGQKILSFDKNKLSVDSDRFPELRRDVITGNLYAVNEHSQMVRIHNGGATRGKRLQSVGALESAAITPLGRDNATGRLKVDTARNEDGYPKYRVISGKQNRYYVYADQRVYFVIAGALVSSISFPGKPFYSPFPGESDRRKIAVQRSRGLICVDNFISIGPALFYHENAEGTSFLKISEKGISPFSLEGDIERNPRFKTEKNTIRIITNRFMGQAFAYLAGSIYLVSYHEGNQSLETKLLIGDFDIEKNLVSRMLYDEGNQVLLLGSFSEGVRMVRPKLFRVVINARQKDFHNVYYVHLPFSKSAVIIPDGIILGNHKASARDGAIFRTGEPAERSSMLKDSAGNFWIFKKNQLYQLTPDGAKQIAIWNFGQSLARICQGINGEMWIGFKNGEVAWLKRGAGSADKPQFVAKVPAECSFLHQDRPGRLWIGTTNGLFLHDQRKNANYPVKALAKKQIRSIYQSNGGELWITTYGDGIFLLSGNRLVKMPLDKNGYLSHAHCILEDSAQNFWISTNKGLFRAAKADLLAFANGKSQLVFYRYFGKDDGFMTNEFNGGCQPCGIKLDDGHFSFPSMSGLVWFKPDQIPYPDLGAPLLFENITVDDKLRKNADTLRLPYNFKHVSFDLSSPYTGRSDNLDFHYRMSPDNGTQKGWIRVEKDQKVNIYGLAPGSYTLVVRKTSGFGDKYKEKNLVLVVNGPWFFSWWFILLALSFLAVLFWALTRWRLANLRRQNALLSQKVEERTENLMKVLDDLRASDEALHTQLQIQMRIIGVINHDVHNPLRYLTKHVPEFIEQVDPCLSNAETARLGNAISKSTFKVYGLVDDLLKFIKSTYNKKGHIVYEQVSVRELLEKKAQFFSEIASENQTVISVKPGAVEFINTNRVMLEIMIHNLLDNAVKHTFGRTVTLSAGSSDENHFSISVEDTGMGIYPEIVSWLNGDRNTGQATSGQEIPAHIGLGLVMVKEIAALLEAFIVAKSSPDGTLIQILFRDGASRMDN